MEAMEADTRLKEQSLTEEAKLLVFVFSVRKEADAPEITEKKTHLANYVFHCRPENRTGV